ncbi:MAG: DUF6807 family protein, partial [Thermoguttaceae bacterium]
GFALRLSAECCGDPTTGRKPWKFFNSQGRTDCNDQTARWVAYQGKLKNGASACVAIFVHPENPRYPTFWQTRTQYPFMNPSLTCKEDYVLAHDQHLKLEYLVFIHPGLADVAALEHQSKLFGGTAGQEKP